jgi:hypothetical protein
MKIRRVGAEFFHTDGRTGRRTEDRQTKLIATFHNFANALKKASLRDPVFVCMYICMCGKQYPHHTTADTALGDSNPRYQDICWKQVMVKRRSCHCV